MKKYATQSSHQGPARFDPDDLMRDEEGEEEKAPFQDMFECHVKNLVEFIDKRQMPQRKTRDDMQNDIVLYIQDETDFYEAWENVYRGEVPDYQNDEDGERYKAS